MTRLVALAVLAWITVIVMQANGGVHRAIDALTLPTVITPSGR